MGYILPAYRLSSSAFSVRPFILLKSADAPKMAMDCGDSNALMAFFIVRCTPAKGVAEDSRCPRHGQRAARVLALDRYPRSSNTMRTPVI
jgi:hypothetical protein